MSNKHKHHQTDNFDTKAANQDNAPESQDEILDNIAEAAEENQPEEMTELQILENRLAEEQAKLKKEKKEYLFLMAEFDNFRKRTIKEKGEIIKNASESVLKGLLPIVDDFERGLAALQATEDAEAAKEGMQLIYNKLMKFLEQNGVKPIESTGQEFNPDLHEAIAMVPTDDESLKGK